jgi:hypothetical protein
MTLAMGSSKAIWSSRQGSMRASPMALSITSMARLSSRAGVDAHVHPEPLTSIVGAMLLGLPLAFAQHLDASAVVQQVQSCRRGVSRYRHGEMLSPAADGAEIGHLPVQAGQFEQVLRHAHRLEQRQIEQALGG